MKNWLIINLFSIVLIIKFKIYWCKNDIMITLYSVFIVNMSMHYKTIEKINQYTKYYLHIFDLLEVFLLFYSFIYQILFPREWTEIRDWSPCIYILIAVYNIYTWHDVELVIAWKLLIGSMGMWVVSREFPIPCSCIFSGLIGLMSKVQLTFRRTATMWVKKMDGTSCCHHLTFLLTKNVVRWSTRSH